MKENSPICASAAATGMAIDGDTPRHRITARATAGLRKITISTVARIARGERTSVDGSKSIPTDTKNSTAKASRIGRASDAARRLNSLRPTIIPARNAPSAIDTPNTRAAPTAIPRATTSTASVNSSREPVSETTSKTQGITLPPANTTTTTSAAIFTAARSSDITSPSTVGGPPVKTVGRTTSAATVRRSSTTSHPTAMWPLRVWRAR